MTSTGSSSCTGPAERGLAEVEGKGKEAAGSLPRSTETVPLVWVLLHVASTALSCMAVVEGPAASATARAAAVAAAAVVALALPPLVRLVTAGAAAAAGSVAAAALLPARVSFRVMTGSGGADVTSCCDGGKAAAAVAVTAAVSVPAEVDWPCLPVPAWLISCSGCGKTTAGPAAACSGSEAWRRGMLMAEGFGASPELLMC